MKYLILLLITAVFISCGEEIIDDPQADGPQIIFKFKLDPNQVRLNAVGEPSVVPPGNAGQSPIFNSLSAHYIELAPNAITALGKGEILYNGSETNAGGDKAIDFSKANVVAEGETFYSYPIASLTPGSYEWLRISLSYQNYDIFMDATVQGQTFTDFRGTAASFLGYNTYITSYKVKDKVISVNDDRLQGYFGFETDWTLNEFQPPAGAITVPNPIFDTSPINPGSCVVTGAFDGGPLVITGDETEDIIIDMSLSTNKSFEWKDPNGNGKYEPLLTGENEEVVVDMGVRGLIPYIR